MRRNSSIIGPLSNPSLSSASSSSGIFDLYDQCMYTKSSLWQNPYISASISTNTINETTSPSVIITVTAICYPLGTYYYSIEPNYYWVFVPPSFYYYQAYSITASDFTGGLTGSFSLSGPYASSSGSFTITASADVLTEGSEQFYVAIHSGSVSGTVLLSTPIITILDTSI